MLLQCRLIERSPSPPEGVSFRTVCIAGDDDVERSDEKVGYYYCRSRSKHSVPASVMITRAAEACEAVCEKHRNETDVSGFLG